jgi:hypothetical protein
VTDNRRDCSLLGAATGLAFSLICTTLHHNGAGKHLIFVKFFFPVRLKTISFQSALHYKERLNEINPGKRRRVRGMDGAWKGYSSKARG